MGGGGSDLSSLIQGGTGVNVVPILDQVAIQTAYTIKRMVELEARTFEPTEQAQESWLGVLFSHLTGSAKFSTDCTPGFYNNEGSLGDPKMARNAPFAGGTMVYFEELRKWREKGDLEGLEISRG